MPPVPIFASSAPGEPQRAQGSAPSLPSFAERFFALAQERSPLVVGLDPSLDLLDAWGLPRSAKGAADLCRAVLDAAGEDVAVFKPQSAFFEAFGPAGMTLLAEVNAQIRAQGALALIDGKRGDVASTMAGYAQAMLGEGSGFGGDAMTAAPWLGLAALSPLFDRALACGAAVFVVVRSSNPEGAPVQNARAPDGRTAAEVLAAEMTALNVAAGLATGPACAVVGATLEPGEARDLVERLPRSLILAPGIGAQGASFADLARHFGAAAARTLPSVSRAILGAGPNRARLREAVLKAREGAWKMVRAAEAG